MAFETLRSLSRRQTPSSSWIPASWLHCMTLRFCLTILMSKGCAKKGGQLFLLISISYQRVSQWQRCVCKRLLIFVVSEIPIGGRTLLTFNMHNHGATYFDVARRGSG